MPREGGAATLVQPAGPPPLALVPSERAAPPASRGAARSAEAPRPDAQRTVLDLNRIVERWDEVTLLLRERGRRVLAPAVGESFPCAVTSSGTVTLQADDESAAYTLEQGRDAIEDALRTLFPGVQRVLVKRSGAAPPPAQRLTLEQVRDERLARMRARDPALAAAIDLLDLELVE